MKELFDTSRRVAEYFSQAKKRFLYDRVNRNNRLIGITGQRGVGKTTLLVQWMNEADNPDEHLYISADSLFLYNKSLFDIALEFRKLGGKTLYIDEVHKYKNWSAEIKHIYDTVPQLNIIFTGSSVLDIMKGSADLSRRAVHYELSGLSFREYVYFETGKEFEALTLEDITAGKVNVKLENPLYQFNQYLKKGYYPFYHYPEFELRLENTVNTVLEVDLIQFLNLKASTVDKLKKLLRVISLSVPFKPNISKIAEVTGISRNLLPDYFSYLERAGLVKTLKSETSGIRSLGKPEKVYLNNTSLANVLSGANDKANTGNLRETFFLSQFSRNIEVTAHKKADFKVADYIFEVGGKNKKQDQIKELDNAYLVKDNIEFRFQNTIPLWHFGFLY